MKHNLDQQMATLVAEHNARLVHCKLCGDTRGLTEPVDMPMRICTGMFQNVRIVAVERQFVLPLTDGKYDPVRGEFHQVCRDCWEFFTFGGTRQ